VWGSIHSWTMTERWIGTAVSRLKYLHKHERTARNAMRSRGDRFPSWPVAERALTIHVYHH
jgi:hypothetical protein